MRFGTSIGVVVLATGVIYGGAAAAADPAPAPAPAPKASMPKASMSVIPWEKAELLPEHALLKGLVGHWTTKVHVFQSPYAKARDTEGTADGKALMGGLFVQVTQAEMRNKQPFEGMTLYGFNEALGKYTADAIDTAATANIHFAGTYDAAKKKLTMTSRYSDGKLRTLTIARAVTTFVDEKSWTYEEFVSHAVGGVETPVVAIMFTRG